jgi:hypothetical protein
VLTELNCPIAINHPSALDEFIVAMATIPPIGGRPTPDSVVPASVQVGLQNIKTIRLVSDMFVAGV